MENTQENKEKFISLYWGQKVGMLFDDYWDTFHHYGVGTNCTVQQVEHIQLTLITLITEEDLNIVTKLIGEARRNPFSNIGRRNAMSYLRNAMMPPIEMKNSLEVIDFLRSRGYALPYMNLSVEKQIEYGWVKLK